MTPIPNTPISDAGLDWLRDLDAVEGDACFFCAMGDIAREHNLHIADLERAYMAAYARFQAHGCPTDRDEALALLAAFNEALRTRPGQVERHAAFERLVA